MIPLIAPFHFLDRSVLQRYLMENGLQMNFSLKHRLYYNVIRPIFPVRLRQRLQGLCGSRIVFKKDCVDSSFVDLVVNNAAGQSVLSHLYPNSAQSAIVLTHDVETAEGLRFVPRVIDLETQFGFRSSWNIVPHSYQLDSGILDEIRARGHEVGIHGYNHDGKLYYSEKIFNDRARYINAALARYGAVGFRSPMVHRNLLWLQKLDIEYDASCFDYDPFQPFPGGTGSIWPFIAGKFVELPYTLPQDHTLFYILKEKDISVWKRKAAWVVENHGMILSLTHPDYLREGGNLLKYEELLRFLREIPYAWHCLPKQMASWWKRKCAELWTETSHHATTPQHME